MKKTLRRIFFSGMVLWSGMAGAQGGFRHPGLLHSEADFQSIRDRVADGDADMVAALDGLRNSRGIVSPGNTAVNEYISRGIAGQENYMNAYRNAALAYQCALMWKITGETSYADRAVKVLDAYRTINKGLGGNTNMSLIPGFIGYQFVNAAEIMRGYEGWPEESFELFKQYMIDVWFTLAQDFLERRHDTVTKDKNWYHYHSNWGLGNALFCVSLGVLCDAPDIYNYGMWWIKEGPGNESLCVTREHSDPYASGMCGYGWGLIPWFHEDSRGPLGYLNQMQESGRDQGHSMAALGLLSYALQSAYNQGDNAFCNLNNSLIPGEAGSAMVAGAAEYVAAYNSGIDDLPYTQNWWMAGLNGTGRGQARPIWQLFINHYENRMGIPMKYCHEMKDSIGMELGGGSYGGNSGGYDHTGFGTLMHNDGRKVTADEVPTILFPQIASAKGETRDYAEISQVEPGTVLTLAAMLPDGETDTGKWQWEDGATGSQRQVTADHSGIYRVTYTNAKGVESTQMFSIAVRDGKGIHGTLTATVNQNGQITDGSEPVAVGLKDKAFFTTAYTNWNYIESEKWYVDGREVGTGGTYTYTQEDEAGHTVVFRLTNQSGVVVEKTFRMEYDQAGRTSLLPDPTCDHLDLWTTDVKGFQTQEGIASYTGFDPLFIERYRDPNQDGLPCWGLGRFNISQTVEGLEPGKYELGAFIVATQQSLSGMESKNYVKDVYLYAGGYPVPVSSQNNQPEYFSVEAYVGEDGRLTFGVRNLTDQDYARSANGMNWFAMDNYSLAYKGTGELAADLAAMRQQAEAVAEDEVTPQIYAGLQAWLSVGASDFNGAVEGRRWLGEAELVSAHYRECQEQCKLYRTALAETYDEALDQALDDFGAADTSEEFYAAWETLEDAWNAYVVEHGMAGLDRAESVLDVTSLLENAGLGQASSGMWDEGTGWKTDAANGNFRVCAVPDENRGAAQDANMVERFGWTSADHVRLAYQSLEGLPTGRYIFQASAFKNVPNGDIRLFANGSEQAVYAVGGMQPFSVSVLVEDGQLAVGLKQGLLNNCGWTAMTDIRLTYCSPLVLLDETVEQAEALDYGRDAGGVLAAAVETAKETRMDAGATTAECMEAYKALLEAMEAYRRDNASAEHPYDVTESIANAGFDGNTADGWTCSVQPGSIRQGVAEFWHTPFDIRQTLEDLPEGYYRIGLQARYNVDSNGMPFNLYVETSDGGRTEAAVDFAAPVVGDSNNGAGLAQQANAFEEEPEGSFTFVGPVFVGDGRLTLGAATASNGLWCVIGGFTLEYQGDGTMVLDETDEAYAVAEDTGVRKVTLNRSLKDGGAWNTFCVPFDMTAEQLADNRITDVKRLAGAGTTGNTVSLEFEDAAAVEAGVPYLVQVSEPVEALEVEDVTVEAALPENSAVRTDGVTMTGNYAATTVPKDAYFISGNMFYRADVEGAVSLKGFRAYVTLDTPAEVNRLLIDMDRDATGIGGVAGEEADPLVDVYSMDGLRLRHGVRKSVAVDGLPEGIYVVGREKVLK